MLHSSRRLETLFRFRIWAKIFIIKTTSAWKARCFDFKMVVNWTKACLKFVIVLIKLSKQFLIWISWIIHTWIFIHVSKMFINFSFVWHKDKQKKGSEENCITLIFQVKRFDLPWLSALEIVDFTRAQNGKYWYITIFIMWIV